MFARLNFLFGTLFMCYVPFLHADEPHQWNGIAFPQLKCEFGNGISHPSISISQREDENGLQFRLGFSWSDLDEKQDGFSQPDGSKITVRLHYADGTIVEPTKSTFDGKLLALFSRRGSSSGSFDCVFPWGENKMQEAWLELGFPGQSYWLEVPYGFTRDPQVAKLPDDNSGPPKLAPAMTSLAKNSQIVNWKHVSYDLGPIQNGWRLSLYHSNPFDAKSEIVLYRDDSEVGKSMFLWDLHTPRTKLSIKQTDGYSLESRAMSLRLHDDGMRRSDQFKFNRNPGSDSLRDWGTMIITVGDNDSEVTMPSSLFRYVHGVSDPYHKATLR